MLELAVWFFTILAGGVILIFALAVVGYLVRIAVGDRPQSKDDAEFMMVSVVVAICFLIAFIIWLFN